MEQRKTCNSYIKQTINYVLRKISDLKLWLSDLKLENLFLNTLYKCEFVSCCLKCKTVSDASSAAACALI